MTEIRPATESDLDDIWRIFHGVVEGGDTYAYPPETTRAQALGRLVPAECPGFRRGPAPDGRGTTPRS